jgi:hypothetical protein
MSQTAKWNEAPVSAEQDRKALGVEKLGVIGGFLVGLPAGLELVREPLLSAGAPAGLTGVVTVAAVALCTWVGLRVGAALAGKA